MNKKDYEQINFDIDYESFNTEEIVKIIEFFNLISKYSYGEKIDKKVLIDKYHEYRMILNSPTFEKKYDKMFFKQTGIKIYQTMKDLECK